MLTTIGLSAKNAILIVEFAKDLYEGGMSLKEATFEAARIRLRPIIMTSLAFGLGVVPLAIATGAGSGSQNAVGTGVLGGVVAGTLLAIFFVPLFYTVVVKTSDRLSGKNQLPYPLITLIEAGWSYLLPCYYSDTWKGCRPSPDTP